MWPFRKTSPRPSEPPVPFHRGDLVECFRKNRPAEDPELVIGAIYQVADCWWLEIGPRQKAVVEIVELPHADWFASQFRPVRRNSASFAAECLKAARGPVFKRKRAPQHSEDA